MRGVKVSDSTKEIIQIAVQGLIITGLIAVFIGCLAAFLAGNNSGNPDQLIRIPGDSLATYYCWVTSTIINVIANDAGTQIVSLDEIWLPQRWTSDKFGYNPNITLFYLTQSNVATLKPGSPLVPLTLTSYSTKGKFINQYPFDKYQLDLMFGLTPANATLLRQLIYQGTYPTLDLEMSVLSTYAWSFTTKDTNTWNSTLYVDVNGTKTYDLSWLDETTTTDVMMAQTGMLKFMSLTIERTTIFRLYPVFQIIAFWLIACALLFLGSTVLIWERKVLEAGIIGFVVGLLFGLPNFRNSAPAAPPIGGMMDFSSFFWSNVAAFTVGLLLWLKNTFQLKINPPQASSSIP